MEAAAACYVIGAPPPRRKNQGFARFRLRPHLACLRPVRFLSGLLGGFPGALGPYLGSHDPAPQMTSRFLVFMADDYGDSCGALQRH
jgi:hypothetical protein